MVIHVETPGGEVIASGDIDVTVDEGRVFVNLHTHDPLWAHAPTESEAMEALAQNLEKVAARIRAKMKEG